MAKEKNITKTLKEIGLSAKEVAVYLALLSLGPSAIRKIAEESGVNRGTTHEALRNLQRLGLASYYHQEKRQHFVAEDPSALKNIVRRRQQELDGANKELSNIIPQLKNITAPAGDRPAVKYYESYTGVRTVLEDALDSVAKLDKKEYVAYSAASIRPYLYHKLAMPEFTDERIKRKITVRTIAIGPGGGTYGKDERRWLPDKKGAPIYTLIYAGKVAMISLGQGNLPHGLIIEDQSIYETQLLIFNALWASLEK